MSDDEKKYRSGGKYPGYSQFIVQDDPFGYTDQEWELLEVLAESKVVSESQAYDDQGNRVGLVRHPPLIVQVHRYLFGRKDEGVLAELRAKLTSLKHERFEDEQANRRLTLALEETTKQLELSNKENEEIKRVRNYNKEAAERFERELEAIQAELRKIVEHYGKAAIERVLNPPESTKTGPANRKVAL